MSNLHGRVATEIQVMRQCPKEMRVNVLGKIVVMPGPGLARIFRVVVGGMGVVRMRDWRLVVF